MKEDTQRDMDHLYVLLDQCTDEDILRQIRKNIQPVLNLVEINIIEALSKFNRISNEPSKIIISTKTILLNLSTL